MADALDQGITVTKIQAMDDPVDLVPHTTAAFVGRALRGPLNTPVLIESFAQFTHRFGGVWQRSSLGPAVQQFFEHGGRQVQVVRVANNARGAMICLPADHGVLVLTAADPGSTEHVRAAVDYDAISSDDDEHFNLTVQRVTPLTGLVADQEIYRRLSCNPESDTYIEDVLLQSSLVRVKLPTPPGRPVATGGPGLDASAQYVDPAQRGSDGEELSDYDLVGCARSGTGLFALESVEQFDLLYLPPSGRRHDFGPAAILVAERYCRRRGAMLILDPPSQWETVDDAVQGVRESGYASSNVLSYFPRMLLRSDPASPPRVVGGAIAGLLCKLDAWRGPWQPLDQPGFGFHRHLRPPVVIDEDEIEQLRREGLNAIAGQYAGRAALCGSVTLARTSQMERMFSSLTVRRLCLQMTTTIGRATRWAVFEAGGKPVAERVRSQVYAYLAGLAGQGAFANDFFDVQCESGLHVSPADPRRGVTILLAFQPADASEVIWLTLHQTAQGCRVASTAFAPAAEECA